MSIETLLSNLVTSINELTSAVKELSSKQVTSNCEVIVEKSVKEPKVKKPSVTESVTVNEVTPVAPVIEPAVETVKPIAPAIVASAPSQSIFNEPVAPAATVPVPAPTFVTPAQPAHSAVPFNDPQSLLKWVMDVYKTMGPVKGAQIQNVLQSLGYANINDVKPEHYAALHNGIETLRVS